MLLRKRILPKTLTDIGATLFLFVAIPLISTFEFAIVLPLFYDFHTWPYYFHLFAGSFIIFNIVSNQFALILCDTSIRGAKLVPPVDNELHMKLWRMCAVCETLTPPRAWHCNTCNTCILKRDHHCAFSGCCVGHTNHRYFLMLVMYICIGTAYATAFNTYFIWVMNADAFRNVYTVLKLLFPFAMIALEPSWEQLYLTAYLINLIGMLFTGFLFAYHVQNLSRGTLVHDRKDVAPLFDLGWRRNREMVFGRRWYLTWLSPFVHSDLPHDGIHWETVLNESGKNR